VWWWVNRSNVIGSAKHSEVFCFVGGRGETGCTRRPVGGVNQTGRVGKSAYRRQGVVNDDSEEFANLWLEKGKACRSFLRSLRVRAIVCTEPQSSFTTA
jgi:hypothetical protein